MKFVLSRVLALLPAPMAWSIVYLCQKADGPAGSQPLRAAWVWRAEEMWAT